MVSLIEPAPKVKKMELPLRHKDTKVHKEFIIKDLLLVLPIAFGM
jgi:hypothetical protein